jgi:hypothetical protein
VFPWCLQDLHVLGPAHILAKRYQGKKESPVLGGIDRGLRKDLYKYNTKKLGENQEEEKKKTD